MRLVMVFRIIYFTLVDYHPVRIANAKLRALTISKKPLNLCMCVRVCISLYDTCKSAYTCSQDREGLVAMAEEIIVNKLINNVK